ncbi:MAG TPA: UDP-N-acetylglucosamine 2-epimerase (non-hydrolyzing) [Candidatus Peribacteria bacterium]|nr:UDP-N-acetylglucosamine 2-epimerase (non-hydrolyzing) [Candidatus Peribacteria bacterium]
MRILSICSARPNFVKLAAVHHAIADRDGDEVGHLIVHTGQHYDPLFSDIFFDQLGIPLPDENLDIHGGTREDVIAKTEAACLPVFRKHAPDWIFVYGDVNGALGAAQAAKKAGIKLAHVEAGLRSFDDSMPEEHNRIAIDAIADLLLVSEQSGMDNLKKEKRKGRAELIGNTMIDTLIRMLPHIDDAELPDGISSPFCVVTLHRPSNVDTAGALKRNIDFLGEVARRTPVVLPLHHRTRASLERFELADKLPAGITVIEPLGYIPFLRLCKDARFILTDSGGIQEEAVLLRKKCFTLRKNTERPSTVDSGSNTLIDLERPEDVKKVLAYAEYPAPPTVKVPELWDGRAGERILASLPV